MTSKSSCKARLSIIEFSFYRWRHLTSRCDMEVLKKEAMYSKYWPHKISSPGTATPHPILTADINNPSLHSLPLSSSGASESLPWQGSSWSELAHERTLICFFVELPNYSTLPLAAIIYWVLLARMHAHLIYYFFLEAFWVGVAGAMVACFTSPPVRSDFSLSCGGQIPVDSHTPYVDSFKDLFPVFLPLSQGLLWCPESLLGGTQALPKSAGT